MKSEEKKTEQGKQERLAKTKIKFSLLKYEVPDITSEEVPFPQESRPKVVGLVTERKLIKKTKNKRGQICRM